jgi:hypothetical protein
MDIDHIFIFSGDQGAIADELLSFGLAEGGSRTHEGQGTANRTFVFENFYCEILWVYDEQAIHSELIKPTGLHTRADFKENNSSPFGLCLVNTDETDQLFSRAFTYQPDYFPFGMAIDILGNNYNLSLPWTFRLPFKQDRPKQSKPSNHKNGIRLLTQAEFQFTAVNDPSFLQYFEYEAAIRFLQADKIWLTLTFDNGAQGLTRKLEELKLTINY